MGGDRNSCDCLYDYVGGTASGFFTVEEDVSFNTRM